MQQSPSTQAPSLLAPATDAQASPSDLPVQAPVAVPVQLPLVQVCPGSQGQHEPPALPQADVSLPNSHVKYVL